MWTVAGFRMNREGEPLILREMYNRKIKIETIMLFFGVCEQRYGKSCVVEHKEPCYTA